MIALRRAISGTTAWNSATVAGWTLVSRITAVLRVVVIGPVLGATYFANAFQTSYLLPHLVFTLIAGPVLGMVLVPSVVRALGAGSRPRARELLGGVAGCLPELFFEPRPLAAALVASIAIIPLAGAVRWTEQIEASGRLATMTLLALGAAVALGVYGLVVRAVSRGLSGGT